MHAERFDGVSSASPAATRACPACSWPQPASTCRRCSSTGVPSCPATTTDQALDIVGVRGGGACAAGTLTESELGEIERTPVPPRAPARACSPPTRWRPWARRSVCRCRARPVAAGGRSTPRRLRLRVRTSRGQPARAGPPTRDIMTKEAFENAIAVTMALGGSTNAVLHLLAIAARGAGGARARRLQPGRRASAPRCRHEAARTVPHDATSTASVACRWCCKDAARRRASPRRRPHRDRPDDGREPGCAGPARARRRGRAPAVGSDPPRGRAGGAAGSLAPRARW